MAILNCGLCQSQSYYQLFHQTDQYEQEVTLSVCETCGLTQLNPKKNNQELEQFYSSEYYRLYSMDDKKLSNPNWLERKNKVATEILDAIEVHKHLKGISLLDIGSSYGFLIKKARDRGCNVFGIEPSIEQSTELKGQGFNIFTGSLQNYLESDYKSFEIITLSHVLEHTLEPINFLTCLRKLLQPDGLVCIEVPNSSWAREFGRHPYNTHSAHIYYYTSETLQATLELSGLAPISTSYGLNGATVRIVAELGKQKNLSDISFPIENSQTVIEDTKKAINRLNPSIFKRIFIMPNLTTRISKRIKRDLDSIKKRILKQKY